jgi:hypothetical protein
MLLSAILSVSCQNEESYDNKVFINNTAKVGELLIKGNTTEATRTIQVALAKPSEEDVTVNYNVDASLVKTYNKTYYNNAVILPAEHYKLNETQVTINAGSIKSKESTIEFSNLAKLSRDTIYVLPITIKSSNMDILKSANTYYFVLKGAALINVVANIEKNYLTVNWKIPNVVNNLSQLTMETLIRVRDYDRLISTVMGIEGYFLVRLGDAGFPSNQIQIATNGGNFPSADSNKGLPTNEWVHIALTYDSSTGKIIVYVNGKVQSEGTINIGKVNLGISGKDGFCIGRSYEDSRYLCGDIAECRIWNIVRTQEEIANNPYYIDPASSGLVAYWKFDDQSALTVKDHTANGNDAVAANTLSWTSVSLPVNK